MNNKYLAAYRESLDDPINFWRTQARQIDWFKFPPTILSQDENGTPRWFEGGKLNTAYLALDRHVEAGFGEQPALIYDSPVTNQKLVFSFQQLRERVAKTAGGLRDLGVDKGDRVIIYMPMVPEAVVAMLACARIGAIHSVVFGGFAAHELALRIDDASPDVILTASCGIEFDKVVEYIPLVREAVDSAAHKPSNIIMLRREMSQITTQSDEFCDWVEWESASESVGCEVLDAWDPLYILYTSGTTGQPKGVLRDNGGHAVALHYSMEAVYGSDRGDVFWASSDVGWVVGHSYIVYGPLLKGCTTVLYEGKPVRTPDAGAFWRVISEHKVKTFFVAPTAFRAVKKEDPECDLLDSYDVSCLKHVFVAGEKLDAPTWYWLQDQVKCPIIDHWWQTESGWPICANMIGYGLHEMRPGSITFPVPGYDLRVLNEEGQECATGENGNVVIRAPLPPGNLPTVWGDHSRFERSYWSKYPGWYLTGDGGYKDEDDYVYIMGRVDDVINVAGHRLSTGQFEDIVSSHPAVAECCVVGLSDLEKGQIPVGLVLLKDGVNVIHAELQSELIQLVRKEVGAFANFKRVIVVPRLPKTRSGKILRRVIRKIGDKEKYTIPSTIDDPTILSELETHMRMH